MQAHYECRLRGDLRNLLADVLVTGPTFMVEKTVEQIEQALGFKFTNRALLTGAFTHSSQAQNRLASNERLEFLGDSVLSLVICKALYEYFPEYLEGDLTKIKSTLVSRKTCAKIAMDLGLNKFTLVDKGISKTRAMSGSIAAGTFEAVVAAIYLDGGYDAAYDFVMKQFAPLIKKTDANQHQDNFKSMLQQYAQQEYNATPVYELLDEKGPAHNKCFEVNVLICNQRFPSAWGITKKEAEQKAAYNTLEALGVL